MDVGACDILIGGHTISHAHLPLSSMRHPHLALRGPDHELPGQLYRWQRELKVS